MGLLLVMLTRERQMHPVAQFTQLLNPCSPPFTPFLRVSNVSRRMSKMFKD